MEVCENEQAGEFRRPDVNIHNVNKMPNEMAAELMTALL